ncbi:unnamed protein product [Penicillium pancosmium]
MDLPMSSSSLPANGDVVGGEAQLWRPAAEYPKPPPSDFRLISLHTSRNTPSHFPQGAIMVKTEPFLPSPPSETVSAVPLDSPIRTTPIHPDLPEVQLPGEPLPIYKYHPVTCQPLEEQDIRTEIEQLRQEFPTKETALRAQELAAKEAKRKIEEAEKKKEQVQKAIDKKVKERDTEMKVLSKYQEVKASEIPS